MSTHKATADRPKLTVVPPRAAGAARRPAPAPAGGSRCTAGSGTPTSHRPCCSSPSCSTCRSCGRRT
ncbi:hypothetical protein ACFQY7_52305 [Actinomadura luteofluorescens]|uniref:hypothetical protein n=1 Tax=Actinomadura luteofluorescens TaxID=46163 RepID=UPI00363E82BB